ncbi:CHASE3 domain-containing protein [Ideonella sp. B7]|uniref:CHASE3 domain-containing protein n=1 Tax=Ideonella benzenivorans TaxID=2831643 RepID=UPI001CEDDCC4|nr:CHASE3 domain-containing protein [Ideonella benzenivorans]MCA6215534.1 CHASE3 domain-containing protein [Ideonella benzenivorans]
MKTNLQSWGLRARHSIFVLPMVALAALAMLGFSELAYQQARTRMDDLVLVGRIRLELITLLQRLTDAESGQRGYLITGRPEYLEPYRHASTDVRASLDALQRFYLADSDEAARRQLGELREAVEGKLSEMSLVLSKYDAGKHGVAADLFDSGIGLDKMQSIRGLVNQLSNRQNAKIERGLSGVFDTLLLNRIGVALLTLMAALVLVLYLRQQRALGVERQRQAQRLLDERNHLEREVARRTAELTELARHLQTAREDERARLARELHDELGALLTAAKLDVARLKPRLVGVPEALERLQHLTTTLNSGIALKRRIIEDLRPSTLSNLGLLPALEVLCDEFAQRAGLPVHSSLTGVALAPSAELTVFRMVQEALTNTAKYAQASEVWVTLDSQGEEARVEVRDNGCGFDTGGPRSGHHGLLGMHYRVEAEHGRLEVLSSPGQGTTLRAWLPQQPLVASPESPSLQG